MDSKEYLKLAGEIVEGGMLCAGRLAHITHYVLQCGQLPGDLAEFGCYMGRTSALIAMLVDKPLSGTVEQPGRNVRAKAGLNRSILDQGWFEFRHQLDYKQAWRGGIVVVVNPRNTSRTCPACGHVAKENRTTQSRFECIACGYTAHADVNAARNILAAGHAVMACGGDVRPYLHLGVDRATSMKQEPAEATTCELAYA